MSDDGREENFAEEDNFIPITVLLIVVATVIIVFCILKSTPATDLEAQEDQAQMTLRSRLRRRVENVGRYFNVGDSDAPVWDSTRPRSPTEVLGDIRTPQEAHMEEEEYYTLAVGQSESG